MIGVVSDFFSPRILAVGERFAFAIELEAPSSHCVQRLEWVVANADVEKVLLDELSDPGDVRLIRLLSEHRAAVTTEAAGAALLRRREEELGSATLARSQCVFTREELIERGVPRDGGA
jgi:hypothetical protein